MESPKQRVTESVPSSQEQSREVLGNRENREQLYEQIDEKIAHITALKNAVRENTHMDGSAMHAMLSERIVPLIDSLTRDERALFDQYMRSKRVLHTVEKNSLPSRQSCSMTQDDVDDAYSTCVEILAEAASNKKLHFTMVVGTFIDAIKARFDETAQLQDMYQCLIGMYFLKRLPH